MLFRDSSGYTGTSAIESVVLPHLWLDWKKSTGDLSYFWVWGAALSVVEVHIPTGAWTPIYTRVVQDCGRLVPHHTLCLSRGSKQCIRSIANFALQCALTCNVAMR
jgi:hypothetical protein